MKTGRAYTQDIFTTGLIRAMEKRLFTPETLRRLMAAGSFSDALEVLRGTVTGDFLKSEGEFNLREFIYTGRKQLLSFTESFSETTDLISVIRTPYDFHNIKTLLKTKIFETETPVLSTLGSIPVKTVTDIFENESYNLLPQVINDAVLIAVEEYYQKKFSSHIDFILDASMYSYIEEILCNIKSSFISEYFHKLIDLLNIRSYFRLQKISDKKHIERYVFIPHGKISATLFTHSPDTTVLKKELSCFDHSSGLIDAQDEYESNPFVFERESDAILMNELKKTDYLIQGIEPLFAFYERISHELKITGIILSCYSGGLGNEFMKLRLSEAAL